LGTIAPFPKRINLDNPRVSGALHALAQRSADQNGLQSNLDFEFALPNDPVVPDNPAGSAQSGIWAGVAGPYGK